MNTNNETKQERGSTMNNEKQTHKTLTALFDDVEQKDIVLPLIEDIIFISKQLKELRTLPFIKTNPNDTTQQKTTPAAKLYKELLQQYNNTAKTLLGVVRRDTPEEESPLRDFLKNLTR